VIRNMWLNPNDVDWDEVAPVLLVVNYRNFIDRLLGREARCFYVAGDIVSVVKDKSGDVEEICVETIAGWMVFTLSDVRQVMIL
jgi:hypothetical protein